MHLIVTHENADFDAVASLLGAAKLYPGALAVIPNRLNRNVRDFVHLYWDEFSFVPIQDIPKGKVSGLTLVDHQHIPPLKGIQDDTQISVIDHHSLSPDLPPQATTTLQETGATTTLIVEEIQRQHIGLTPNQATLMLLGIYEDTGSLSYPSTTARDAYAAAWLLDQNASLQVMRQFLNYPLSDSQRDLYQQLSDNLETHQVAGHSVIIAAARASGYVEEVSTLAHQLRAMFKPDALFLLVAMDDHIQVVARSNRDDIDVGAITAAMGGGGHTRAAAALIRHTDLDRVRQQLLDLLDQQVAPSVVVGKIMSHGVHTLAPNDTVTKAAEMMTRYGHEGFPVVQAGRIVGVLTRREIDKALHHRLGGSAVRQVMRQGEFFVTPGDPVETLQRLMIKEGLGQVPVVEEGKVVGIVTRTDLINLWSHAPSPSRADEISARLEMAIPPRLLGLLREAGNIAAEHGDALYIVGGFVRDLLLFSPERDTVSPRFSRQVSPTSKPYLDIDLVVEGDAIRLAREMARRYGGQMRSHQRFGTAKWLMDLSDQLTDTPRAGKAESIDDQELPPFLDFVTARTEFYQHPSALPEVERSSIKQDLHRRDFTINTLAIQLSPENYAELLDFYGGESDLRQGLIRVLHSLSFVEDPTRILRAVRLEQRLAFRIEAHTLELCQDAADLLDRVSGERVYHELHRIFEEAEPEHALQRLNELGILQQIHSSLTADEWVLRRIAAIRTDLGATPWANVPASDVLFLGVLTFRLPPKALDQVIHRLRIRAADATVLRRAQALAPSRLPRLQMPLRPSQIFRELEPFPNHSLLIGWLCIDDQTVRAQLAQFERELAGVEPIIDGHYLQKELGIRPGPVYRRLLDQLRAARLDGEVVTLSEERAWVKGWMDQNLETTDS